MPRFKVAHVKEQGVNLIIIPLENSFGSKSNADQDAIVEELQVHATSAGLAGTVVPVWNQHGRMQFKAPPNWHPFFRSLTWNQVLASLNKELFW